MAAKEKGFTLLELVIAITLLAMMMAALVIGLRVGVRAWQSGEARLRTAHRERERGEFLARQVASLVPYAVDSTDQRLPGRFFILEATASRLRFLSSYASRGRGETGLTLVELAAVSRAPRRISLVLRETPAGEDGALLHRVIQQVARDAETGRTETIHQPFALRDTDLLLFEALAAAQFDYFGRRDANQPAGWAPKWEGTPEAPLPAAVRLRWQRKTGEKGEEVYPIRAQGLPVSEWLR